MTKDDTSWLDAGKARAALQHAEPDRQRVADILLKARELKGLNLSEVAVLSNISAPEQMQALFDTARFV
jgi:2-iminoacetate synthase